MGLLGAGAEGYFNYKAADKQAEIAKDQLDFQKEMYDKWYGVYGTLQEDMGTYYKNLTGEKISAKERQALQIAAQNAQKDLSSAMTAKGITGSGIEASMMGSIEWEAERAKALSQANAEDKAMSAKMGFLGLGVGKDTAIANGMANAANAYGTASSGALKSVGETLGYLGNYMSTTRNPTGATINDDKNKWL